VVAVGLFFVFRPTTQAAFGPAVALCPGPDLYGYACEGGAQFAYIEATTDTQLYEDDGVTTIELPFPFTFYGTTYTEVQVSSNGNLQFGNANPLYLNNCLNEGPVADMGDMIAPYWDDLDLRFQGFLKYTAVGTAPDRIFVVEWDDIPRYGEDDEDRVTFEVQLFESSNDIVFLYQDVTTMVSPNGSSATIGLQSEAQGLALQYGCNQAVVADARGIHFPHPTEANEEIGRETVIARDQTSFETVAAKGHVAELIAMLERRGPAALPQLRRHWLSQTPPRATEWQWQDLTGDGGNELVLLWRGPSQHPELAQLAVLASDESGQMELILEQRFSTRQEPLGQVSIYDTADLTADGSTDLIVQESTVDQLFVLTAAAGKVELLPIPERCQGSLALLDRNGDGRLEIGRDGCENGGRRLYAWNGREFAPIER
jgi:hypothetical protein